MKLISWNVNGIRACVQKGFLDFFHEADADIFCIQETKMQEGQLNLELERYHQYWNYAVKKGYSGTAVFTKKEPLSVSYGLGIEEHDQEGRDVKNPSVCQWHTDLQSCCRTHLINVQINISLQPDLNIYI